MEDKAKFVEDLNKILIEHGGGRYDHLLEVPLVYAPIKNAESGEIILEVVTQGANTVNVTGDSLTAIIDDLRKAKVI